MYNDNALELWNELKERFSHTNSVHLFHIDQEIHDCVQGGMNIGEYYTKLKGLWDTRDVLCPLPPCDSETTKKLHEYQQKQRTIRFLMGLDGTYTTARGQILLIEPLPAMNKVFSLIIQDEKQRSVSSQMMGKTPDAAAFAVKDESQKSNRNHPQRNAHLKCDRCNIMGHSTENCRAHLKCDYCGFKGHTIDVCRKLKRATSHEDKKGNSSFSSKAHYADSKLNNATSLPSSYSLTAE
ncbi:uncharacterized protein LOC112093585 [Morus notabilis]|uniref:uncharacterized protein LOC112093585 n=1 Tax=Morus notabilis TaxID=981085 RepID=UPI000CED050A|nr:uncharacterized protein LOC112093585 [Morus notabilis]